MSDIASRLILITQRSLLEIIAMTLRELEDQALRLYSSAGNVSSEIIKKYIEDPHHG
ncbi:MAG: hypothetical protein ACYTXC_01155 [Nostoc sp.]